MDTISDKLLYQRVRNRIIEVLEVFSSLEEQEKVGADELMNMWEDYVDDKRIAEYVEPVFTIQEQEYLAGFHRLWNYEADNTPKYMPPTSELANDENWKKLMSIAEKALQVFNIRGKLSEDIEVT